MKDGSFFRDVDLLSPEHIVDPSPEAGFLCQMEQEREGLVTDAVLRIIQVNTRSLGRHALAPKRII